jgi:hypothetical protein
MTNRTVNAIKLTNRADAKSNPRWLTIWLDQLPYSYRWPSYAELKKKAAERGYSTDAEGIKALIIDAVSKDVRREALRLYGETHPQADPNYKWSPSKIAA